MLRFCFLGEDVRLSGGVAARKFKFLRRPKNFQPCLVASSRLELRASNNTFRKQQHNNNATPQNTTAITSSAGSQSSYSSPSCRTTSQWSATTSSPNQEAWKVTSTSYPRNSSIVATRLSLSHTRTKEEPACDTSPMASRSTTFPSLLSSAKRPSQLSSPSSQCFGTSCFESKLKSYTVTAA